MSNPNDRPQWDAGRFIQTLAYFEVIPFVNWLPFNGQKAPVIAQVPLGAAYLTGDECPTGSMLPKRKLSFRKRVLASRQAIIEICLTSLTSTEFIPAINKRNK